MNDEEETEAERDADDAAYEASSGGDIPPIDFNIFVLSLNASALIHLGEAPSHEGKAQLNLPMARQTIDMLCILEEKTRGNLSGEEERLLHQVLFDLRMRFTSKAKQSKER